MQIRRAEHGDAHAIAEIHVTAWRAAYRDLVPDSYLNALSVEQREPLWSKSIETGDPQVLVATDANGVCGWVAFGRCRDSDKPANVGEVWAIYVSPAHWSTGIGRALWSAARERLQQQGFGSVTLWVFSQNQRACQFYHRAGFRVEPDSAKLLEIGGSRLEEVRYELSLAG